MALISLIGFLLKLQACQIRNFIHQLLMPTRPLKNEIMGCEGAFEDILAFFQATPAPSFCTDIEIDKKQIKDIVRIDASSSFKDLVLQSQELHDGENLVKTVRFLIKQSDFQITQKLVKWRCLHLVLQ